MSFNCKAYIKLIDLDKNTKMISITSRPNTAEKEKVKETTAKSKVIQKTSNLMMTNIKVNHSTRLAHVLSMHKKMIQMQVRNTDFLTMINVKLNCSTSRHEKQFFASMHKEHVSDPNLKLRNHASDALTRVQLKPLVEKK